MGGNAASSHFLLLKPDLEGRKPVFGDPVPHSVPSSACPFILDCHIVIGTSGLALALPVFSRRGGRVESGALPRAYPPTLTQKLRKTGSADLGGRVAGGAQRSPSRHRKPALPPPAPITTWSSRKAPLILPPIRRHTLSYNHSRVEWGGKLPSPSPPTVRPFMGKAKKGPFHWGKGKEDAAYATSSYGCATEEGNKLACSLQAPSPRTPGKQADWHIAPAV